MARPSGPGPWGSVRSTSEAGQRLEAARVEVASRRRPRELVGPDRPELLEAIADRDDESGVQLADATDLERCGARVAGHLEHRLPDAEGDLVGVGVKTGVHIARPVRATDDAEVIFARAWEIAC